MTSGAYPAWPCYLDPLGQSAWGVHVRSTRPSFCCRSSHMRQGRRWHIALRWSAFLRRMRRRSDGDALRRGRLDLRLQGERDDVRAPGLPNGARQTSRSCPLELCLLIVAGAVLARGLRLSWLRIGLLLGLLHLALKHARHADLMALLGRWCSQSPLLRQWFNKAADQGPTAAGARRLVPPASPASPTQPAWSRSCLLWRLGRGVLEQAPSAREIRAAGSPACIANQRHRRERP